MLDFFVLGAQKAGTSTLHEWLVQSPEVALPWSKETHFFRDENKYVNGIEWYREQFRNTNRAAKVFGEVDPEYMYFPECAERIRCVCDAPKLIVVLREPVARALSHYRMSQRRGYEVLSFYEALVDESRRLDGGDRFSKIHHSYIDRGTYGKQLERIASQLPNSELLVLKFEDLYSSQESALSALKSICNFIGVDDREINVDVTLKFNKATTPRSRVLRDLVYGKGKLKSIIGALVPSRELKIRILKCIDGLNMKPTDMMDWPEEGNQCPSFVYEQLIGDLRKLQSIVDIDVSDWVTGYLNRLENR